MFLGGNSERNLAVKFPERRAQLFTTFAAVGFVKVQKQADVTECLLSVREMSHARACSPSAKVTDATTQSFSILGVRAQVISKV